MEISLANIKEKYNSLDKPLKIIIGFVVIVILGSLLFSMGYVIGEAIYKALY